MADLLFRADYMILNEIDVTNHRQQRNGISVLEAKASFVDKDTERLGIFDGRGQRDVTADGVPYEVAMRSSAKSRAVRLSAIRPAC